MNSVFEKETVSTADSDAQRSVSALRVSNAGVELKFLKKGCVLNEKRI